MRRRPAGIEKERRRKRNLAVWVPVWKVFRSRLRHHVDLDRIPTDDLFMVGDPACDRRERGEVEERESVMRIFAIRRLLQIPFARQRRECLIELGRGRSWHEQRVTLGFEKASQDVEILIPMFSTPIEVPKQMSSIKLLGGGAAI